MRYLALILGLIVQLTGYLLFCKGFFPTKVLLTPNEVGAYLTPFPPDYAEPKAQFDKVVFMVVDAMRADFLFSDRSNMPFAHSLINNGLGLGFTAFSNPPTVTLPRLKGITTGSTPNFIDAVLNIAEDDTSSSLGDQDSWVKQMYSSGWKINMFGDDTWHKLFPGYFSKTEGTSSFYVSDFTIVDNNVTRHLDFELSQEGQREWDCLILHYLGMDHIGHKGGPSSQHMPLKQKEMDGVISRIYNEVIAHDPNTLLVVMGDHGMNDIGNHGGSSTAETSAALLLVSQKFKNLTKNIKDSAPLRWNDAFDYFHKIDQIDLVPTLTELTGLNIPINNLGAFVPEFLELYESEKEKRDVLLKNALQLKVLLDKSAGKITSLEGSNVSDLIDYIHSAKEILSRNSSAYNYRYIALGLGIYSIVTVISFVVFAFYFKGNFWVAFFDVVFFVVYSINFIASSMVEEEHHLWWFFTSLYAAYTILCHFRKDDISWIAILSFLLGLRLLKAWNNSGQKHNLKKNMKISTYITKLPSSYGPFVYSILLVCTILPMVIHVNAKTEVGLFMNVMQVVLSMLTVLVSIVKMLAFLIETYNVEDESLLLPPWSHNFLKFLKETTELEDYNEISNVIFTVLQQVWLFAIVAQLLEPLVSKYFLKSTKTKLHYFSNMLAITAFILISQTNYSNVPIFPILYMILLGYSKISPETSVNSNAFNLFTLLLQNLSFFQFGLTNSLSSVDLTNSFNGLSSYNVFLSGLLTYTCNWAGPLFWSVAHLYLVFGKISPTQHQSRKWKVLFDKLMFNFVFYSTSGLLLLMCCYHLRFHLFIWTVFSPKILYFLSWLVCNLIFDTLFSIIIVGFYV